MENKVNNDQQPPSDAGKGRKKFSRKFKRNWLLLAAVLLLGSFILEYLSTRFGVSFVLVPLVGSLAGILSSFIRACLTKQDKEDKKPSGEDGVAERILIGLGNVVGRIYRDTVTLAVCAVALMVLAMSLMAACHAVGWAGEWGRSALDYINPAKIETPEPSAAPEPEEQPSQTDPPVAVNPVEREEKPTPAPMPTAYLTLLDPGRADRLPDKEKKALYFQSGAYTVEDWEDAAAVEGVVYAHVCALYEQQRENLFDRYAPQYVQDEVSQISALEARMSNSGELDEIIDFRTSTYVDYPMYRLAKLLAENYSLYGLAYDVNHGDTGTVEYYYGAAVSWYNEGLSYRTDDKTVRELLRHIGDRYHDLAAYLPRDSEYQQYAAKLAQAYYAVMNRF